ncbi:adenosine deaminase-like protein isoform X2 [Watersipora subatra]
MFKLVHSIVNDLDSLYQATCAVIDDFANDGVVYLELRSTPRAIAETDVTQDSYMRTVLRAIRDKTSESELGPYDGKRRPIVVRYLAAIDRRNSVEHAMETVDLAIKYKEQTGLVVGVDLSGDSSIGDATTFVPVLVKAVSHGLKLALHLAEVDGIVNETSQMLELCPHRIGHGTFIHPKYGGTQQLLDQTRSLQIPLELCLTSNVKGQVTPSFEKHHFQAWHRMKHPIIICTDDKGVFATKLSDEYKCVMDVFKLSRDDMLDLAYNAINYIFEDDSVKDSFKQYFTSWRESLKN